MWLEEEEEEESHRRRRCWYVVIRVAALCELIDHATYTHIHTQNTHTNTYRLLFTHINCMTDTPPTRESLCWCSLNRWIYICRFNPIYSRWTIENRVIIYTIHVNKSTSHRYTQCWRGHINNHDKHAIEFNLYSTISIQYECIHFNFRLKYRFEMDIYILCM